MLSPIYLFIIIIIIIIIFCKHICNICSKNLQGSSRELTLFTFEYFKNTKARQDRTHTHTKSERMKRKKQQKMYIKKTHIQQLTEAIW